MSIWLLAPTAIEADFRFRGLRIADWLRGTMSSREFLVLVQYLDDESAFKKLAPKPYGRDGDWSEAVQIAAKTHEEFAMYRASKYVGGPHEYRPMVFIPPAERAAQAAESADDDAASMDLEFLLAKVIDQ